MKTSTPLLRAFIAGSAFPVIAFPLVFLAIMSLIHADQDFTYQYLVIFFPLSMGFWNILFLKTRHHLKTSVSAQYWIYGILLGTLFPILGNISRIPQRIFQIPWPWSLSMIPLGMLAYGLIWRYVTKAMNEMILG